MARPTTSCCDATIKPAGLKGSIAGSAGNDGANSAVTSTARRILALTGNVEAPKIGAASSSAVIRKNGQQ